MQATETTISQEEYFKASNLHTKITAGKLIRLAIATLLCAFMIASLDKRQNIQTFGLALIYFLTLYIGVWILLYLLKFYLVRRNYRLSPLARQPVSICFLHNGLLFKTTTGENLIEWKYIVKWRQNKEFILVYLTPSRYSIIPKRLESNGLNIASLENALLKHVGKEK